MGKIIGYADVIKYEGDNQTFIWKSEYEDFNTTSQLIVHESQEAIFFMNGQALDTFPPGRYTLETQNIPLIGRLLHLSTGDKTPFHCEVYFINKTEQMAVTWGTDSKVTYEDPQYHFPLSIGASGEMTLKVGDSRKLLINVVGTETSLTQEDIKLKFRAFLQSRIKPYLARTMREQAISIFETDEHMGEISGDLHRLLTPDFSDYGLVLERFFVTTIVKPEGEKNYERFKELRFRQYGDVADAQIRQQVGVIDQETDAKRLVIESQSVAQKRQIEGYTYQQERGFDVAENVARNEGIGNFSSAGIGLGMMGGVAGGMGAVVAGITTDALNPVMPQQSPMSNGFAPPAAGFGAGAMPPTIDLKNEPQSPEPAMPEATTSPTSAPDDMASFKQRLEKLKMMKDMDMLSDEEFAREKQNLLDSL